MTGNIQCHAVDSALMSPDHQLPGPDDSASSCAPIVLSQQLNDLTELHHQGLLDTDELHTAHEFTIARSAEQVPDLDERGAQGDPVRANHNA